MRLYAGISLCPKGIAAKPKPSLKYRLSILHSLRVKMTTIPVSALSVYSTISTGLNPPSVMKARTQAKAAKKPRIKPKKPYPQ